MPPRPSRVRSGLLVVLLAGGCAVGPDFARPAAPPVTGYETEPIALPAPGDPDPAQRFAGDTIARRWWELFHSPALDQLLALAVADSPTLVSARATLAQAEQVVLVARAAYYPQVDLAAAGSWQNARSLGGSSSRTVIGNGPSSLTTSMFNIGPALTYTPDFFGQNRRFVEQQTALAENQAHQLAAAYLTLTASAVTQALTIASTEAQITAVNDIVAADEHNLELVRISFQAGSVARTDVLSAESQLAGDRTLLPPLLQQLSVARHTLAILVGKSPGEWAPPDFELETLALPGDLPLTVPSELVRRRPDILAAEAQLHAASRSRRRWCCKPSAGPWPSRASSAASQAPSSRRSTTAAPSRRSSTPLSTRTRTSSACIGRRCSWRSARSPTSCARCSTTPSCSARRPPP
jgi:NodT family efflux transporter outer membrane factor (OMF) lipoprotein